MTNDEYTPTTDAVKRAYASDPGDIGYGAASARFDRWLAAHDAERDALAQQIAAVRAWLGMSSVQWSEEFGEEVAELRAILDPSPVTPESETNR